MNTKRWIALVVAAAILGISLVINSAFAIFQSTLGTGVDDLLATAQTDVSEEVIEDGDFNKRIAVLNVEGTIQDTGEASALLGQTGYNHGLFMEQLEQVKNDDTVKAVMLKVNSPGGGVVESAEIHDKITEIQEETKKPFYVSMGATAASGGYYISAPADKIFVNRETMTGSLGVIMQTVNYGKLAEKYGVEFVTIKSGPFKDIGNPTREMTADEQAILQEMLNDSYESFVDVIAEGRDMSEEQVKKLADGRIMNGRQAVDAKLADDFGFEEDVLAALRTDFNLEDAQVFEYGASQGLGSLFSMKLNSLFGKDLESQMITKLLTENSSPRMMYLYGEK
ncbi:signal peptide peptidase SppA [Planococcus shenhongbingii]|uniref:Signal peptide peptidase SppA n=1 Tax=Planococcus shenhongbingii TaxID=3058398 RepID=A0ABT8NDP0_9BACL|nr:MULTISPECIES: signal peptide peptidase SppA [unclassified Planococcus (in: firmicutes)]MDN7246012.1 signal peptide peptidase SppA [Planococcus sp. N017]WKA59858.1 signal peptide peptidase SppA [Planococcus sp. N016]